MTNKISIAMVAGEVSGDKLGSALIDSIKAICEASNTEVNFWGVGGEEMISAGLQSLYPMDDIAVMGLIEPLKILPQLIKRKNQAITAILQQQPDIYIGIDSPDFTLRIAKAIKASNPRIPTIHYVSPSVWAWRQNRVYGIKATIDLMITLFPFESAFYNLHKVPNICVGHSMAEKLPLEFSQSEARTIIAVDQNSKVVALLPGSRGSEIERHLTTYLEAAVCIDEELPCHYIIPVAKQSLHDSITAIVSQFPNLSIEVSLAKSSDILHAADVAIVTSGTATLEALLCQCPIVVGYKTSAITYAIAKRLVKSKFLALPNLLNQTELVAEYVQDDCTAANLSKATIKILTDSDHNQQLKAKFRETHEQLKLGGSDAAAEAVLQVIATHSQTTQTT